MYMGKINWLQYRVLFCHTYLPPREIAPTFEDFMNHVLEVIYQKNTQSL